MRAIARTAPEMPPPTMAMLGLSAVIVSIRFCRGENEKEAVTELEGWNVSIYCLSVAYVYRRWS